MKGNHSESVSNNRAIGITGVIALVNLITIQFLFNCLFFGAMLIPIHKDSCWGRC